jgi:hypothetical protein
MLMDRQYSVFAVVFFSAETNFVVIMKDVDFLYSPYCTSEVHQNHSKNRLSLWISSAGPSNVSRGFGESQSEKQLMFSTSLLLTIYYLWLSN